MFDDQRKTEPRGYVFMCYLVKVKCPKHAEAFDVPCAYICTETHRGHIVLYFIRLKMLYPVSSYQDIFLQYVHVFIMVLTLNVEL